LVSLRLIEASRQGRCAPRRRTAWRLHRVLDRRTPHQMSLPKVPSRRARHTRHWLEGALTGFGLEAVIRATLLIVLALAAQVTITGSVIAGRGSQRCSRAWNTIRHCRSGSGPHPSWLGR